MTYQELPQKAIVPESLCCMIPDALHLALCSPLLSAASSLQRLWHYLGRFAEVDGPREVTSEMDPSEAAWWTYVRLRKSHMAASCGCPYSSAWASLHTISVVFEFSLHSVVHNLHEGMDFHACSAPCNTARDTTGKAAVSARASSKHSAQLVPAIAISWAPMGPVWIMQA